MDMQTAEQLSMSADIATVLIAIAALAFSIYSTWYMYWRAGRLVAGRIAAFMAGVATEGAEKVQLIGVPLRVLNVGARPVIVERLRLQVWQGEGSMVYELDRTEVDMLDRNTQRSWMSLPFALCANETKQFDCVFIRRKDVHPYRASVYRAELELQISGKKEWLKVLEFIMKFDELDSMGVYNLNNYFKPYQITE